VAVELIVFGVEVIDPPARLARYILNVTLWVDLYLGSNGFGVLVR